MSKAQLRALADAAVKSRSPTVIPAGVSARLVRDRSGRFYSLRDLEV